MEGITWEQVVDLTADKYAEMKVTLVALCQQTDAAGFDQNACVVCNLEGAAVVMVNTKKIPRESIPSILDAAAEQVMAAISREAARQGDSG